MKRAHAFSLSTRIKEFMIYPLGIFWLVMLSVGGVLAFNDNRDPMIQRVEPPVDVHPSLEHYNENSRPLLYEYRGMS